MGGGVGSGMAHERVLPVPDLHDDTRAMPEVMRSLRALSDEFGAECLGVVVEAIANPKQPGEADA